MGVGERLTGWVAENRQPIVNSDAGLDLGQLAPVAGLRYCLALPMVSETRLVGVLTLYGREQFADEQTDKLRMVAPHLGRMFLALETNQQPVATAAPARTPLRVVASR